MTQPTSWAELLYTLRHNGNTPLPVTDQNREAARALKAKGLAVIRHRNLGLLSLRTTVHLKETK